MRPRSPSAAPPARSSVVTINGARVPVAADGKFATQVPLREGENVVQVEAEDVTGRRKTTSTTLVRQPTRRPKLAAEPAELWNK